MVDMQRDLVLKQSNLLKDMKLRWSQSHAEQVRLKVINDLLLKQLAKDNQSNDAAYIFNVDSNSDAISPPVDTDSTSESKTTTLSTPTITEIEDLVALEKPFSQLEEADFKALKSQLDQSKQECRELQIERIATHAENRKLLAVANNQVRAMTYELIRTNDELERTGDSHKAILEQRRNNTTHVATATPTIKSDIERWNSDALASTLAAAKLSGELNEARSVAVRLIPALCQHIQTLEQKTNISWGTMKDSVDKLLKRNQ